MDGAAGHHLATDDGYIGSKASKFRMKSGSSSRKLKRCHLDEEDEEYEGNRSSKRHRQDDRRRSHREPRERKHHRRHKDSNRTMSDHTFAAWSGEYANPNHRYRESIYDSLGDEGQPSFGGQGIDSDAAFRESLFDALADDEGAIYWEGVYGQPIHIYPDTKAGPNGELEQMSEEEYAEYVRRKMWEKSHQHLLEERKARAKEIEEQKNQNRKMDEETMKLEAEREAVRRRMQESIRRGEERKKAREINAAWTKYLKKWEELRENHHLDQEARSKVPELIPWPVLSGKMKHVSKAEIEYFFENSIAWKEDAVALLKVERVRWHPDKMQQRFGQHIDENTMKAVTAVFQVVDRLWNERRK
ncbi:hypothetical protein CC78DRAFT_557446 [Lojkania enalia]|uniref:NF-kappa-B inhibitor-like protein 1 n=1 Tax=Lojkania enalia TaxID=147567 RepID=A0A9P4NB60_9PLEO|nr:hypothetical protein CC78DRAFT_557446 [Didymosphaeria enalia]